MWLQQNWLNMLLLPHTWEKRKGLPHSVPLQVFGSSMEPANSHGMGEGYRSLAFQKKVQSEKKNCNWQREQLVTAVPWPKLCTQILPVSGWGRGCCWKRTCSLSAISHPLFQSREACLCKKPIKRQSNKAWVNCVTIIKLKIGWIP